MRTFGVAPLSFFYNSSLPLERGESGAYERLLRTLASDDWTRLEPAEKGWFTFTEDQLDRGDSEIQSATERALGAVGLADVAIVDLRAPRALAKPMTPMRAFHRVSTGIREYVATRESPSHVVLLLSDLVDPYDLPFRAVADLVEDGSVSVVSETGYIWSYSRAVVRNAQALGSSGPVDRFTPAFNDRIPRLLRESEMSLAEAVRRKTIRRLGYFPRFGADAEPSNFNRYFYDGSFCGPELAAILTSEIRRLGPDRSILVVYDLSVSTWLQSALSAACTATQSNSISFERLRTSKVRPGRRAPILLVTPLVETDKSLRRLASAVRAKYPHPDLHAFTVYSAKGPTPNMSGAIATTHLSPKGSDGFEGRLPLRFVQKVVQQKVRKGALLPDVGFYAQREHAFESERFVQLTADDFWTLSREFPLIAERNVPEQVRVGLDVVPDFPQVVAANGPWLASKFQVAAQRVASVDLRESTLLTMAEEDGAVALADSFELIFGNRPIGVPRADLDEWRESGRSADLLERWRDTKQWAIELDASPSGEVVVLDEFSFSGTTVGLLAEMAATLGREVPLILAIAGLSMERITRSLSEWRYLFLYETEVRREGVA